MQEGLLGEEDLGGVPVLVFANKQDLLNAMTAAEIMKSLELTEYKDRFIHVEVRRLPSAPDNARRDSLTGAQLRARSPEVSTHEKVGRNAATPHVQKCRKAAVPPPAPEMH